MCYVSAEEPRKHSVGIELKEVDRVEYQVSVQSRVAQMSLRGWVDHMSGALPKIIAKNHDIS